MKIKNEFDHMNSCESGRLWNGLTEEQKREVLFAYNESFTEEDLVSHEEVMKKHEKWLKGVDT
jgi:hypothetical protein